MEAQKAWWDPESETQTREEYIRETEEQYRHMLPWDDRQMFDDYTADILNRHFSLDLLAQAAVNPELPEYIRESLVLTVWARAVILGRRDIATEVRRGRDRSSRACRNHLQRSLRRRRSRHGELRNFGSC
jgi:hypothetical protein